MVARGSKSVSLIIDASYFTDIYPLPRQQPQRLTSIIHIFSAGEDWTFEISRLLLNRFLYHEIYDEYYAGMMSKREWNRQIAGTKTQALLRSGMFKRIIPNLVSINLLTDRIRPHYERLGLLAYEDGRASDLLSAEDLLADR